MTPDFALARAAEVIGERWTLLIIRELLLGPKRFGDLLEATKPHTVDMGGFGNGREISKGGTKDLPLGPDSITGFMIVNAANLDDAEKMAQGNPYISSIRIYEIRTG